jgi:PAS domain S-box-containing protein
MEAKASSTSHSRVPVWAVPWKAAKGTPGAARTGYVTAVLASALAACLGMLADPLLDEGSPLLTPTFVLLLAVMLATRYGGRGPGLLAVGLSVLVDAFFFMEPTRSLRVSYGHDLFNLALFVIIAGLVIGVIEAQRAAKSRAEESAHVAREGEERFRRLVEGVKEYAFFLLDEKGCIESWNPGVARVLGWREEILGKHISCVFTEDDQRNRIPEQEMDQAIREGMAAGDRWYSRKDGSRFFASGVTQPIHDENGVLRGFTKVMRDSTERRRLEYVRDGQADVLDRLLSILNARPHRDEPLRQVLAMIAELLQAEVVCLLLPNTSPEEQHTAWRPEIIHVLQDEDRDAFSSVDAWVGLTSAAAVWQEMTRTRWPVVIDDCVTDERIAVVPAGIGTLILSPMLLGDESIGALCIAGPTVRNYLPEEVELSQALAQQAALALQLRRLGEQEQRNAVLAERNRIAGEIHDTLAQSLTGILLHLETAEWEVVSAPEKALARLARSRELAKQSLAEARRSVWALHPGALEHGSLSEALQRHIDEASSGSTTKGHFHVVGELRPLPPDVESNLLRIGIEAITNVLKHANAREYFVVLEFEPELVRLSVTDTGMGFVKSSQAIDSDSDNIIVRRSGFGLISMRDRAERLGGRLLISNSPGAGVQITAVVPTSSVGTEQIKVWTI